MRILHVAPTYLPAVRHGGPIFAVHGLCRALAAREHELQVFTTNRDGPGITPTPSAVDVVHMREQREASQPAARVGPVASFAIMMRYKGEEQATDIPLPSPAIEVLALEAISRDLGIAELIGQSLVAAINKDVIHKILLIN